MKSKLKKRRLKDTSMKSIQSGFGKAKPTKMGTLLVTAEFQYRGKSPIVATMCLEGVWPSDMTDGILRRAVDDATDSCTEICKPTHWTYKNGTGLTSSQFLRKNGIKSSDTSRTKSL